MRLSGQNVLHYRAVQWYYDVMAGGGPGVPESIIRHIRQCWACRQKIHRLKEAVTGAGGETDGGRFEMKRDIIDTLNLHFGCLEEQVTCLRVKPFLPGLLTPSVQIRIPTPITVHIDHCPECAEDLEALRSLDLGGEQLARLEQLYQVGWALAHADSNLDHSRTVGRKQHGLKPILRCRRARASIADFVRGALDEIDSAVLNHLSVCPRCRGQVFRSRQKLLEEWPTGETGAADCGNDISTAQLFDYAVPYGRTDPVAPPPWRGRPALVSAEGVPPSDRGHELAPAQAGDARATFGPGGPVPQDHVHACRACLARIQRLDETIYGIAERTNSGIATIYSTLEQGVQSARQDDSQARAAEEAAGPFAESYPEYAIRVQVIHGEAEQGAVPARSPAEVKAALRHARCNPQVRLLLKTAVAAAAVILLTVLFRSTASSTAGITLAQVFKAFGRAENVHISRFYPPTGQLTQELWISRGLNFVVTAAGQDRVLYDLIAGKKYACPTPGGAAEAIELTDRTGAYARRLMASGLGFTPDDVPSSATWTRVDEHDAEGLETYDLTYSELAPSGATAFRKLRIMIDPATELPRELQRFRRTSAQDQWNHQETTTVQYPTENEMEAVLEEQHLRSAGKTY